MRELRFAVAIMSVVLPVAAHAELFDRGNGLIYDDELDITWVQMADLAAGSSFDDGAGTFGDPATDGLLTWASATAFVDSLSYAGFDDWRLPTMDVNGDSVVVNCAIESQTACLDNELGYLYYYGLGGTGGPLTGDTAPFTGILFRYWGSDEVAPSSAWTFDFVGGIQGPVDRNGDAFGNPGGAWAVRSGDVTETPIPVEVTVPANLCIATAGGCNPTGLHEFALPDSFVPPPGATITQTVFPFVDSRADANGRCDGQSPQVLFDGDLIIPEYLCGSPEFQVIVTETNFEILEDTIVNTVFPDEFVSNPIDCDIPIAGDRQLQSAFVWQPTNSSDVLEGHAIALTNDCGSSRGRMRGFSFIVVGLHIDFGLDFNTDSQALTQAFADLTSTNLHTLVAATANARPALKRKDFRKLVIVARLAERLHNRGRHHAASRLIRVFLFLTDRARFNTNVGFNHQGNLLSRADHIKFLLDEFITPF